MFWEWSDRESTAKKKHTRNAFDSMLKVKRNDPDVVGRIYVNPAFSLNQIGSQGLTMSLSTITFQATIKTRAAVPCSCTSGGPS